MKPSKIDLFIFVGEHSGDLHGEAVLKKIKETDPTLTVAAVAGPRMRKAGLNLCVMPMENFKVMGFIDVMLALPRIMIYFYRLRRKILALNPKVCLFIDYPGFNLKMESSLKKKGYEGKLLHFISPTVWAWKKKRAQLMEKTLDHLFVILPFEKAFFAPYKLQVDYVGHPLVERLASSEISPFSVPLGKKFLAIFPGSRAKEIERNFPLFIEAFKELQKTHVELLMAVSVADLEIKEEIYEQLKKAHLIEDKDFILVEAKHNYALMKSSFLAFAKSGTITLELALLKTPTIVAYAISKMDLFLAQKIFHIDLPFYSLPNLLLQKEVFPELIGPNLTLKSLLIKAEAFFEVDRRNQCLQACQELSAHLGSSSSSKEVTNKILSFL